MGLEYRVKRIKCKEQIEQCERFFIDRYMWDSKQNPPVYGWLGYVENEGLFVKMVCEEKNPKRVYYKQNDLVLRTVPWKFSLHFRRRKSLLVMNACTQILK